MAKAQDDKPLAVEPAQSEVAPAAVEVEAPKRHLTRESLELTLASRFESEGKSPAEAKKLAVKRALEICPD